MSEEEERRAGFVEAVNRICLAAGGVRVEGPVVTWQIDTRAGKLHVSAIDNASAPWIACRFLQPERVAAADAAINHCNGRWNFRLWTDWRRGDSAQWEPAYSNGLRYFAERLKALL